MIPLIVAGATLIGMPLAAVIGYKAAKDTPPKTPFSSAATPAPLLQNNSVLLGCAAAVALYLHTKGR